MDPIEQTSLPVTEPRKSTFADTAIWMRGLYMLLLALAFGVAQTLLCVTAVVQFLWLLFTGETNQQVARFGGSLSRWFADTARFLSGLTETKPFPWAPWPSAE